MFVLQKSKLNSSALCWRQRLWNSFWFWVANRILLKINLIRAFIQNWNTAWKFNQEVCRKNQNFSLLKAFTSVTFEEFQWKFIFKENSNKSRCVFPRKFPLKTALTKFEGIKAFYQKHLTVKITKTISKTTPIKTSN